MADPVAPTDPDDLPTFAEPYPDQDTQDELEFSSNANRFSLWLPGMISNFNDMIDWIKTTADQVFGNAGISATNAEAASDKADEAAASALAAAGYTNFEGEWSDLSGAFTQYHTCENNGIRWYAKVAIADITADEPVVEDATWGIVIGSAGKRSVKDAGDSYSVTDIPSAGLTSEIIRDQQAYKGDWRDQTGVAIPPYLVSYQSGSNDILQSEALNESGSWDVTRLEAVADSGIAAPTINGETFGNYWEITPDTDNATHDIGQTVASAKPISTVSFLMRENGYDEMRLRIRDISNSTLITVEIDLTAGTAIVGGDAVATMVDQDTGDWLVTIDVGDVAAQTLQFRGLLGSSETFAGTGTDGVLITRVHFSDRNAPYAKTTTTAIEYTPPEIYQLLEPLADVTADEPGASDVWGALGSGGGISYVGTQTYTSADEDGSDNIDIPVDFTRKNWVDVDCSDASISTSGAYEFDITGLQTDTPATYTIHIKGGAVKSSVTYALPAGWTADWHATPTYAGAGSGVAARRAGHTYITIQTDPLAGQNANFSLGDSRAY